MLNHIFCVFGYSHKQLNMLLTLAANKQQQQQQNIFEIFS